MNIPATLIAWIALAVSVVVGIFSFTSGRDGGDAEAVIKQLAGVTARVEQIKPFDAGPLEGRIAELAAKVEAAKPADIGPLEGRLAELSSKVEAAKPFDPAPLEAQIAELSAKLDAVKPYDPAPLIARLDVFDKKLAEIPAPLEARLAEITTRIASQPEPPSFDPGPLMTQLDDLAAKIETAPRPEPFDPSPLQARIDDMAKRIAALQGFDPSRVQKQLDALSAAVASSEEAARKPAASSGSKQRLLGRVFFGSNDSRLDDDATKALDGWIAELAGKPHRLAILGFSDSVGRAEYNVALSIRRAVVVRRYLLNGGLAEGSVVVSAGGYGEDGAPVETDDNVDEPQNRTVHVYVYE